MNVDGNSPVQSSDGEGVTEIRGVLGRIVFTNKENGFTVARMTVSGNPDPVTVVGVMLDPAQGQTVSVTGSWNMDPTYGLQFKAESCVNEMPSTEEGVLQFLQSKLVKGVGKQLAKNIVARFGEATIDILDNDPDKLTEVPKVGPKMAEKIKKAWDEHVAIRSMVLFLQSHGISTTYALRIIKHYGARAVDVVKANPYRLALDMQGIGFITADRIAQKLGFPRDSPRRAEAGLVYVLSEMSSRGHVFCPLEELLEEAGRMLEVEESILAEAMDDLREDSRIMVENLASRQITAVYPSAQHAAERGVAHKLRSLLAAPRTAKAIEPDKAIEWVQKEEGLTLADKQAEAVRQAARSKVLVVTGGPGTGKTTIIKAILRIFSAIKARTYLAAPTGRAAKRMSEATGYEARTIHRLLEWGRDGSGFGRGEDNPLHCSLLILDETSMIDNMLMYQLLKAVPLGATLILVGDVNQLPSVGPGNVLRDIIASKEVPVVELTDIFRQAGESRIIVSAHEINDGRVPDLEHRPEDGSDFYFVRREDPEGALELVKELVATRIPSRFGLDPVRDIQVLAPMHKGVCGVENLNRELQMHLNPVERAFERGDRRYAMGDKVMQIKNNYDKDVFNGDMGRIAYLDRKEKTLAVDYDGVIVEYESSELDEVVPAYAVSIHKSQGSEYPAVVIPVLTQHYVMLQRNLLYTAVTRGKQLVMLVGSPRAVAMAVRNNAMRKRYTNLKQRLRTRPGGPLIQAAETKPEV